MRCGKRLLGGALALGVLVGASAQPAVAAPSSIVDEPVSFQVRNTNTSKVSCASDGRSYTVRGHLTGPRGALRSRDRNEVTLYYHGLGLGEFFWRFRSVPGYDFGREMARLGNVSLTIDRLGYDASGKPDGKQSCYGSQADIAHQIIGDLRRGSYSYGGAKRPSFDRVVLAGHSAEGFAVQNEAYSYRDIDGLLLTSFADMGQSALTFRLFGQAQVACSSGGERSDGSSGPGGYNSLQTTDADFRASNFFNADPAVIAAAGKLKNRDPCGETGSAPGATASDLQHLGEVRVPVLLAGGDHDALFPPAGVRMQAGMYSGSRDVTVSILPSTGHLVTLGRSAPSVRGTFSDWLRSHGFQPQGCPVRNPLVNGDERSQRLLGGAGADTVLAQGGDDRVRGRAGGDCLRGGSGGDRLRGESGDDELEGGSGRDTLNGGPGRDRVDGGSGGDYLSGNSGGDRIAGAGGNDRLYGRGGRDRLDGGPGRDLILGGSGNDRIFAADGRRDRIRCGPGRDRVRADRFDRLRGCERVSRRRRR